MKNLHFLVLFSMFLVQDSSAQKSELVGLPMAGHVSAHTANILVLAKDSKSIWIKYVDVTTTDTLVKQCFPVLIDTLPKLNLHYYKFQLDSLTAQSDYKAFFYVNKISTIPDGRLKFSTLPTKGTVQDFSFHLGSCAAPFKGWLFPFRMYNKVFDAMYEQESDFMLWMGDNVYYLNKEWYNYKKMVDKNLDYRTNNKIARYLNSRPQYATWDDHDYGPNNADGNFGNRGQTLKIFKNFWANKSWGLKHVKGVFGKFSYSDADFFIMDSRWYRQDTTHLFGVEQLNWLKDGLKKSNATFKFIVSGTQILPHMKAEDFGDYPKEKEDFLAFLENENIKGVIFLSGDTHYAEMSKLDRPNTYPLYEMTASALTSPYFPGGAKGNDLRIEGTLRTKRNFGKIKVEGTAQNRKVIFELYSNSGKLVWQRVLKAEELK